MKFHRLLPVVLLLSLSACSPSLRSVSGVAVPIPSAAGALSGLVGSGATGADAQLVDLLNRQPQVPFPARLGVVFYGYTDPLKPEDQQTILDSMGKDLTATGLVRSIAQIPANLVTAGASIDTIRQVAARFQVDIALIVSGQNRLQLTADQPSGLFTTSSTYESRTTLSGLALGVYSGTFLTPFEVAGKGGPVTVDPNDPNSKAALYKITLDAQTQALNSLKDQFIAGLKQLQAAEAAATPAPSPSATASAAASASPGASTSPSPSAATSASPSASTSPSASPSAAASASASPSASTSPSPSATPST